MEYYGRDGYGSHYARFFGSGICRSDDDGKSWSLVLSQDWFFIHSLGFNQNLTIARNGDLFMWTYEKINGVLRSTDRGATWKAINEGLKSPETAKVLGPDYAGVMIAQDATYQVYRRNEENSTWMEIDWRFPYPWGPAWEWERADQIASSRQGWMMANGVVGWMSRDSGRTWDYLSSRKARLPMRNLNPSMYDSLGNVYILSYESEHMKSGIYEYMVAEDTLQSLWYNLSSYGVVNIGDVAVLDDGTVFAATDEGLYTLKTDVANVTAIPSYPELTAVAYPSPAGDAVTLSLSNSPIEDVDVTLCTLLGREFGTFVIEGGHSDERIREIDIHGLSAGVYILKIRAGSKVKVIPFLKQ